ncbi:hypothetical protein ADL05_26330 [Nocardiopsis sp. NRRL B-16309]|nr:hypothetical protein ADL05_26330 [Nocardiopsis sp. NRRL B-16309]
MMSERVTFADMNFRDYLKVARTSLDDAELAYDAMLDDPDARDDMDLAFKDGGYAISLAWTKGMADAVAMSQASRHDFVPEQFTDADMWAAIAADVDAGLTDPESLDSTEPASDAEAVAAEESRVDYDGPEVPF